jgi:hypothetical protein
LVFGDIYNIILFYFWGGFFSILITPSCQENQLKSNQIKSKISISLSPNFLAPFFI